MNRCLIFFKLFLILSLVSACKEHAVSEKNSSPKVLEQKSYFSVDHEENKSLIRTQMAHTVVDKVVYDFKSNLVPEGYFDEKTLRDFQHKSDNLTKVVVSYLNRYEVYFVPAGLPCNEIIPTLNLTPDQERVFSWVSEKCTKTDRGQLIQIMSINHDDLMKLDQFNFSLLTKLNENFTHQGLILNALKSYEVIIDYQFEQEDLVWTKITNYKIPKCTRDRAEAGMCEPCTYMARLPSEFRISNDDVSLEELGISLFLNGVKPAADEFFKVSSLKNQLKNQNRLSVLIDQLPDFNNGIHQLSFSHEKIKHYLKNAQIQSVSNNCLNQNPVETYEHKTRSHAQVSIVEKGRGDALKRIQL